MEKIRRYTFEFHPFMIYIYLLSFILDMDDPYYNFAGATPKRILQMMGVRGLRMSHVKSHLQVYLYSCVYIFLEIHICFASKLFFFKDKKILQIILIN